ncbi:SDR family NAD(P)-dependent oxidoreductase [Alkalicoccobacillus plakortidis]|uniref:SDR family NAD(P)-dependent oxidoreductase n=1 Tax=Alkalicoccobacillus plakortidis TaxID=444060 RepID=A0ABT0XII6_9BACI|nr:SDR family NAD(P)-dependent oxidoreductase [Alkalicoccobacillus plakortidis]MCM2675027.1 SDR family NAD(P)-dependent oxidoreductase [Alkalicoccobacillus plakortidis]
MNLLVTGGAGFIGSHLCEELMKDGHKVTVLDNFSNGKPSNIAHLHENENFQFVEGDCTHFSTVDPLIKANDVIFHLAAILGVKHCVDSPLNVIKGNLDGTSVVLKSASAYQKKVIFASSSEVYGKSENYPFKEDGDRLLGSTDVHRWCYSTAKSMEEHLCLAYGKEGLPVTILRYFNAYGPRATDTIYGGVVPIFVKAAMENRSIPVFGDGNQSRCFTFVKDTARATALVLKRETNQEIINIGSNHSITIRELAETIKAATNSSSEIKYIPYEQAYGSGFEDMKKRVPHIEKARKLLRYVPDTRLVDGINEILNKYQKI